MPLPTAAPDKSKEADSVIHYLKMIRRDAIQAQSLNNIDILTLHHQLVRAGIKFSALHASGLTKEVLGPVIETKLGINWVDYSDEYTQLVEVDMPMFVSTVRAHQTEICQQEIATDRLIFTPISQATKDTLLPLINKIANAIEG